MPPLPPHIKFEQAKGLMFAVLGGDVDTKSIIIQSAKEMMSGVRAGHDHGRERREQEAMKPYQRVILTAIVTIIIVLAVEFCVALAVMWWGVVYIGADRLHPQPIRWYLSGAMEYSVKRRAQGLKAPAPAQVRLASGAAAYGHLCVFCHGAPGVERSPTGQGLSPHPPALVETANDWTVEQVYWIAAHGVGDTGMPAFGITQEEQELWAIAYFVKQLPQLTPEEYKRLVAE